MGKITKETLGGINVFIFLIVAMVSRYVHMSDFYTLSICSLLYGNYTSITLFFSFLNFKVLKDLKKNRQRKKGKTLPQSQALPVCRGSVFKNCGQLRLN